MAIQSFIKKVCVQDAVYWEFAGVDGFSVAQFAEPVEIKVRWDETAEVVSDNKGKEFVSKAQLLVPQDLKEQSFIKLGDIRDIDITLPPTEIEETFEVRKMERYPTFRSKTLDIFIGYL